MHPIAGTIRDQVDPKLTFTEIFHSPDSFVGKKIILGGEIVVTHNLENVSEIVVVQKSLDSSGYPSDSDNTQGRFIFRQPGYLESEIYSKGRRVTGAGTVVGSKQGQVGETEYRFPVIEIEQIHLWEKPEPFYYSYPYYWGPYYPGYYYPWPRGRSRYFYPW